MTRRQLKFNKENIMKTIITILCCALSFPALAQIAIPSSTPTYVITSGGVVLDASGVQDADPQEPILMTTTEIQSVKTTLTQKDNTIKQKWTKRHQGAGKRALINPQLIK
jgi:hypothetical protein